MWPSDVFAILLLIALGLWERIEGGRKRGDEGFDKGPSSRAADSADGMLVGAHSDRKRGGGARGQFRTWDSS